MRKFGLIGHPLTHSFSKKYFTEKFENEGIEGCSYELYDIPNARDLEGILRENPEIEGINVTIPHKEDVIALLDDLDEACEEIGAVNCIHIQDGMLTGYNTDYIGFKNSLLPMLGAVKPKALVLGTGGASKAVKQALKDLAIEFISVSRSEDEDQITYEDLSADPEIMRTHRLIVNTTPLGTFPNVEGVPAIPMEQLTSAHLVYDLVYNPPVTALMKACMDKGGKAKNGQEMLMLQAEAAWEIWNS
ncbi:shikimate dehydrogenase family protein [Algoriphagus persicinus]|uniref:shikimate dehydrogenase family protein n=1 Tax=Algoriphagus persicinus TaxID=3108754 RepID=UPI002B3C3190|nr:shikimate dehydrogenase [Algoriphagus sp. E1-3-M2]MEB2783114.1 shikimate dehydrogenase [Algoriphagus sp. E1-3-M2]